MTRISTLRRTTVSFALLIMTAFSLQACFLALVPVVYMAFEDQTTATVEIPKPASEVFETAVKLGKENPDIVMDKIDDKKMTINISKQIEINGKMEKQTGVVRVAAIKDNKSQLFIYVDSKQGENMNKELSLKIATMICDALKVKYTVVKS